MLSNRTRRSTIVALAVLAVMASADADTDGIPAIGYVANRDASAERLASFRKGLSDRGYVEGTNIRIEYRYATFDQEYAGALAELVSLKVDVVVAGNAPAAVAAASATRTIPIVLAAVNDPVGLGVVESLEHPGRNITGTTIYAPRLIAERVRVLKRVDPSLRRVAVFMNGSNKNNPAQVDVLRAAATEIGVEVETFDIRTPTDVEPAVKGAIASGAGAFLNCVDSFVNSQRFSIAKLAVQARRTTIFTDREYVLAGGLMAIGVGHTEGYYGAAGYVDKILRGANPADLSIAAPTTRTFSVSRSVLSTLRITLPREVSEAVTEWLP
jgi:putative tryptophan/tyrosine transport system substrate-binding protein